MVLPKYLIIFLLPLDYEVSKNNSIYSFSYQRNIKYNHPKKSQKWCIFLREREREREIRRIIFWGGGLPSDAFLLLPLSIQRAIKPHSWS